MTANTERRATVRPAREERHRARAAAIQMLYQWEVGKLSLHEIRQTFWMHAADDEPLPEELRPFAQRLAAGVVEHVAAIDPLIGDAAQHWRVERMNVLDRLILRLAIYEFLHERGTPPRVVINEALELARTYSTDEAVRFINGILDAIRKRLELNA